MLTQRIAWILWPAFLVACAMEVVFFTLFDPEDLHFLGAPLEVSRMTVYSAGFFVFCRLAADPLAPGQPALHLLTTGIFMNVSLALFNLLPLPPLDGAWLASWGLPRRLAEPYDRLVEPWGAPLLMLLVATGAIGRLTGPPIHFLSTSLLRLAI